VIREYGGDATAIWAGRPTVRELQRRLDDFPGIGQKKAAMAVEILERDLGVEVMQMSGSDIAYDIHVRRVFLRTGLAEYDSVEHMVAVARELFPERPGTLDEPAWFVGQNWCHPSEADCPHCVLRDPCARLIDRTIGLQ
jgi:endonuclease III